MSQGDDHHSAESLRRFLLGTLSAGETRAVIGHLARGCQHCRRIMAPLAVLLLGGEPLPPAVEAAPRGAEYDTAIERSIRRARNGAGFLARPARRGQAGVDLCRALLARGDALGREDPRARIRCAELACAVAENLPAERCGSLAVADLQAQALAELADAHRAAGELEAAEALALRALRRAEAGTGDTFLLARLLELAAAFAGERRRSGEAAALLDAAHALYAERGERERGPGGPADRPVRRSAA